MLFNIFVSCHFRSMVGFTPKQRVMSTSAKNQSISNLKNTITGFKALVGRSFSDPVSQSELECQPYEAEQLLPGDKIGIKVSCALIFTESYG